MKTNTTTIFVHVFSWLMVIFLPYLFAFPTERLMRGLSLQKLDRNSIRLLMMLPMIIG